MDYVRITILIAFFSLLAGPLCGEEPFAADEGPSNAALVYWQAFAMLPELDTEETQLLAQVESGDKPVAAAKAILSRSGMANSLAKSVTPKTDCRWDLIKSGPGTLLPHLGKARLLARLMVLQARADAAAGNSSAAVDQLTAALLVARNVDEGVLIQMLVGDAIESLTLAAAEPLVAKLDAKALDQFADALSQLPPRTTVAQAIAYERDVFGLWLRPFLTGDAEKARAMLAGDDNTFDIKGLLGGTKAERTRRFDEFISAYNKMIEASKLPPEKIHAEFERLELATTKSSNPLVRLLMPAVGRANVRHAEVDKSMAKFEKTVKDAANAAERKD